MFALFSIGSYLQRYDTNSTSVLTNPIYAKKRNSTSELFSQVNSRVGQYLATTITLIVVVAAWPFWAAAIYSYAATSAPVDTSRHLLPQSYTSDQRGSIGSAAELWQPRNSGEDIRLYAQYTHNRLPPVRAIAFLYKEQHQGKEMVNAGNVLVDNSDTDWRLINTAAQSITLDSGTVLNINASGLNSTNQHLIVWQWYRIGDEFTSSSLSAKIIEIKNRLLFRRLPSVNYMLVVDYTEENYESALLSAINIIYNEQGDTN